MSESKTTQYSGSGSGSGIGSESRNTSFDHSHEITDFHGHDEEDMGFPERQLTRTQSVIQRVQTKLSFFNEKLESERWMLVRRFFYIYLLMGLLMLSVFSIYWGSMYGRENRMKNLRMLVVIEDDETVNGIPPVIGDHVRQILQLPSARHMGNWLIQNTTEFEQKAAEHNNTIFQEIQRQIHHQNYWSSIYVKKNASSGLYNAIVTGDTSYNVSFNSIVSFYETGRDFMAMNQYVTPTVREIETMVTQSQSNVMSKLLQNANHSKVFSNPDAIKVASTGLDFTFIDARPYSDPVLVAPSQVGLIYTIIITFFAFNFFSDIHRKVLLMGVKVVDLMLYRVISTMITFFFMSLFYSLVTLAFQVDFTKAFGKSGFLVYWMTNFLTMWAVGAMNEAMGMMFILIYPPLMGFWMLFWVILNIAPTFTPLALSPKVYRYGYAMPIYNSYEITKVIFFDTYKGHMGRNYGILVVNVIIATILLLIMFKIFGQTMAKRARAERAKIEEECLQKHCKDRAASVDFEN